MKWRADKAQRSLLSKQITYLTNLGVFAKPKGFVVSTISLEELREQVLKLVSLLQANQSLSNSTSLPHSANLPQTPATSSVAVTSSLSSSSIPATPTPTTPTPNATQSNTPDDPEDFNDSDDEDDEDTSYSYPCCKQVFLDEHILIECSTCFDKLHLGPVGHCSGVNISRRLVNKLGYKYVCKACY